MKNRVDFRARLFRAVALTALLALLGCGGSNAPVSPSSGGDNNPRGRAGSQLSPRPNTWRPFTHQQRLALQQRFQRTLPPHAYVALSKLGMPAPSAPHAGSKTASVVLPHFFDANQAYMVGDAGYIDYSAQDVAVTPGPPPIGSVDMFPSGTSYPGNFTYIMYRIDDIVGQTPGSLNANFGLTIGDAGVAVYNWGYGSTGRWEPLYYGPAVGTVQVDLSSTPGAQWTNGGDDLAFCVFALNPALISLSSFQLEESGGNQLPIADIVANPSTGQAPLNVLLDASTSFDPDGTIVNYQFDPEGTGTFIDNGGAPTFNYVYVNPGVYDAAVLVTDDDGDAASFSTQVFVSPTSYDEVENNDNTAEAQTLPATPFSNFSGNGGPGGPNDGDTEDWYTFTANPGDWLQFTLDFSDGGGSNAFTIYLWDAITPFPLAQSFGGNPAQLDYQFTGFEAPPYYLQVVSDAGMSDYFLACDFFTPPPAFSEVEDNDDSTLADYHGDLSFTGSESSWTGSLGPGGGNYDGDNTDWSAFDNAGNTDFPDGTDITLNLTYDDSTGNLGMTLFDAFGVQLASSADGDGSEDIVYTVQAADVAPFFLEFSSSSGYSDYTFSGSFTTPNPGFDETENNDDTATANPLTLPETNFTANIGSGGSYDGDSTDIFSFTGAPGEMYGFTIVAANTAVQLTVDIVDSNGTTVGGGEWDGAGTVLANAVIRTNDASPFFLIVEQQTGETTDYTISGDLTTTYLEVEDNDSNGEATPFPANFSGFTGSLGAPGYDGDNNDYFSFFADDSSSPIHDLVFDDVQASITATIYDSDGDVMGTAVDQGGGVFYVDFDDQVDAADTQPFFMVIQASSGVTNYWLRNYDSYTN
jgi:hypothetical protein